jgi:hypothetical protein
MTHKNYAFLIPKTRPRINLFPRFVIQHSDIDLAHIPLIGELHSRSLHQVGLLLVSILVTLSVSLHYFSKLLDIYVTLRFNRDRK